MSNQNRVQLWDELDDLSTTIGALERVKDLMRALSCSGSVIQPGALMPVADELERIGDKLQEHTDNALAMTQTVEAAA